MLHIHVAEEHIRILLQGSMNGSHQFLLGVRLRRNEELGGRAAHHHRAGQTLVLHKAQHVVTGAIHIILHRAEVTVVLTHLLHQRFCIDGASLCQGFDAKEIKEARTFLLRLAQRRGAAKHLLLRIGIRGQAAFHNGLLEQSLILRRGELHHHAAAAGRLSADGDVFRVAAKGRDVALHPAGACLLVEVAEVCGRIRLLRGDIRVAQEAEGIQPVVDRHHHNAATRQPLAVKLHLGGMSHLQAAAEIPHIYRQIPGLGSSGSPYVQVQAILAHLYVRVDGPFSGVDVVHVKRRYILHGDGFEVEAVQHTVPVRAGLRGTPAVFAHGGRCKGNAFVGRDARVCRRKTANPAVFCFHLSGKHVFPPCLLQGNRQ